MTEMTCDTCRWWVCQGPQIAKATATIDPSMPTDMGACHGSPPMAVRLVGGAWHDSVFPVTSANNFCAGWDPYPEPDDGAREDLPDSTVVPFEQPKAKAA